MRNPFRRRVPGHLRSLVIDAAAGDQVVVAFNDGFVDREPFFALEEALAGCGAQLHMIPLHGDPADLLNLSVIRTA